MNSDNLHFTFPLGNAKELSKETSVTLLPTNGLAEKIFVNKKPSQPYTWLAEVLSVAIATLGENNVGASARKSYSDNGVVTIPECIKNLSMSDANTLLVEIHRRVWEDIVPSQEVTCKYCGSLSIFDIDLWRSEFDEEDLKRIEEILKNEYTLPVRLNYGWKFEPLRRLSGSEKDVEYGEFEGVIFNKFTYRLPTVRDAIRFEESTSDSIVFWRQIAKECLIKVEREEENGVISSELPSEVIKMIGIKLYNEILTGKDLKIVRTTLREKIPTLPFSYKDTCPSCTRKTPVSFDPSSFFGE